MAAPRGVIVTVASSPRRRTQHPDPGRCSGWLWRQLGRGRTFVTQLYSNHGRCKPIFSNSKSCIECSLWAYLVIKIQTHILGRFGITQWHYFNAVVIKLRPCSPLGTRVGHVRGEAGLRNSLHSSPRVTCHDGQMLVQGYLNMLGNR